MELINELLNTTINSFDFGYCVTVNVLTYIIIKSIGELSYVVKLICWFYRQIDKS